MDGQIRGASERGLYRGVVGADDRGMESTPQDRGPRPKLNLDQSALAAWLGNDAVDEAIAHEELRAFLADRRIHVSRDEFDRWIREIAERARKQTREGQERPTGMRWT